MPRNIDTHINTTNQPVSDGGVDLKSLFSETFNQYIDDTIGVNLDFLLDDNIDISEIFLDFKSYLDRSGSLYLFPEDFLKQRYCIDTISNMILKFKINRELLSLGVNGLFAREYLLPADLNSKLSIDLSKLTNLELSNLSVSMIDREEFIQRSLNLNTDEISKYIKISDIDNKILDTIFTDIDFSTLDTESKNTLIKMSRFKTISPLDFSHLFSNISSDENKNRNIRVSIIKYFIPTITLADARDLGLVDDDFIQTQIEDLSKARFHNSDISFINPQNIFIDTKKLPITGNEKKLLEKLYREYSKISNTAYIEGTESNNVPINTIDELLDRIKNSNELSDDIKSKISYLSVGSYLNLISNESGKTRDNFFYLQSSNDKLEFVNVSIGEKKYTSVDKGLKSPMDYMEFYESLKKIDRNRSLSVEVQDIDTFNQYVSSNGLKETVNSARVANKGDLLKFLSDIDPNYSGESDRFIMRIKPNATYKGDPKNPTLLDESIFNVTKIDDNFVYIDGQDPVDITSFAVAFEDQNVAREPIIGDINALLNILQLDKSLGKKYKDFQVIDGQIYTKDSQSKSKPIKFLEGDNGFMINIKSVYGDKIDFTIGKFHSDTNTYKASNNATGISLTVFKLYLQNNPTWPIDIYNNTSSDISGIRDDFKPSPGLLKQYLSWGSIADIMGGGKMLANTIKNYFTSGSELKSRKFAKALGRFIPSADIRSELEESVEKGNKELMEKKMAELKSKNTEDMVNMAFRILERSTPSDPELEAALMAIVSKTSVLYPRSKAYLRGSYMWYKALGGKFGSDSIYDKYQKICREKDIPFTEEFLIVRLLKEQARAKFRRNRIDKEYQGYLNTGINDEMADGKRVTDDMISTKSKLDYMADQLEVSDFANAFGAIENIWAAGSGPKHLVGGAPFILFATKLGHELPERLIKKYDASMGVGSPLQPFFFLREQDSQDKYIEYIKRVLEIRGDDAMLSELNSAISKSDIKSRVKRVYKFWINHGGYIYDDIAMNSHLVQSRLFSDNIDKKDEILRWYYDKVGGIRGVDGGANMSTDRLNGGWTENHSIASTGSMLKQVRMISTSGRFADAKSRYIMEDHANYFKKFVNDTSIDINIRKKFFFERYELLERSLYDVIRGSYTSRDAERLQDNDGVKMFRSVGIEYFNESKDSMKLSGGYSARLERKWDDFINGRNTPHGETKYVQQTIFDIINKTPANDDNSRLAA